MAIEILRRERETLRAKAREYFAKRHNTNIPVRTMNMLRLSAQLTAAIVLLRNGGVA